MSERGRRRTEEGKRTRERGETKQQDMDMKHVRRDVGLKALEVRTQLAKLFLNVRELLPLLLQLIEGLLVQRLRRLEPVLRCTDFRAHRLELDFPHTAAAAPPLALRTSHFAPPSLSLEIAHFLPEFGAARSKLLDLTFRESVVVHRIDAIRGAARHVAVAVDCVTFKRDRAYLLYNNNNHLIITFN